MPMKRILYLFLLLFPSLAFADHVQEEQARQTALAFWQSVAQTRGAASPSFQMVLHSEGLLTRSAGTDPAYYVFDNTAGPGFVIVAGDDIAMPVLAYSFTHEFSAEEMPANLRDWLTQIRGEINETRRQDVEPSAFIANAWTSVRAGSPIVELETALWNQAEPYNEMCPQINHTNSYTGCTATAVAIVMRYHQWPEQGTGTLPAYVTETYHTRIEAVQLGHTYDWADMRMEYPYNAYSQTEADAVATLMRDCAIGIKSDFGPVNSFGTGANISDIPLFLTNHMGYDQAYHIVIRNRYNTEEWHRMMRNELDNNRPIIYTGSSNKGGHAFILDGYDSENYFSVNWGWGGMSNGYFLLSALDPNEQGAGGSDSGYNKNQNALIGIQKDHGGSPVEELRLESYTSPETGETYNGLSIPDGSTVVQGKQFMLQVGNLVNNGSAPFTGHTKIALADKEGNIVEDNLSELYISELPATHGYCFYTPVTIHSPVLPGYRLRCYYKSESATEWEIAMANEETGCVWDLLIGDEYSIEESTRLTYDKHTRIFTLQVKEGVTATLASADGNDYSDLCKSGGNQITIDASSLPGGTYRLTLQKNDEVKVVNLSLPDTAE